MSTMSNFPKYVAIYRPAENGYQVIFVADGKFQIDSNYNAVYRPTDHNHLIMPGAGVWFHIAKSNIYPQDDTFQVIVPSPGKEVYYWPTGFDLVRNVPKSWPKVPEVRYPIFQFLKPPVSLSLNVISAVACTEMNKEWISAMKVIRSAALLEQREFKDMPGLDFGSSPAEASPPVVPMSITPMPPLEDMSEFTSPTEGTHWGSIDVLMEAAKRVWWNGWRSDGTFRKRVRILDLDMLEPVEFLHYLRLVSTINKRTADSGGKQIDLKFTNAEIEKMKTMKTDEVVRTEIVTIMSQYV